MAELLELLQGDIISGEVQHGVEQRTAVSVGQDEAVAAQLEGGERESQDLERETERERGKGKGKATHTHTHTQEGSCESKDKKSFHRRCATGAMPSGMPARGL